VNQRLKSLSLPGTPDDRPSVLCPESPRPRASSIKRAPQSQFATSTYVHDSLRLLSIAGDCNPGYPGYGTCVQFILLERLQFAENSGNQFRHRRMYVHGPLHHCVRGTRIHHVQDAVDRLIAAGAENGCSQDFF